MRVAEDKGGPDSKVALIVVIAASVAAGWLVFAGLVGLAREPRWDEAAHLLQGALVARDVRELDGLGLLFDTYRQVYWPPLHSWLVGIVFLVAGPSLAAGRLVSVLAYALLAPTLFLVARAVTPRRSALAGVVAAALALTSPGLVRYAAEGMLELPGLLALAVSVLAYCRLAGRLDSPARAYALAGIGIVVTYLLKTNYAVLLVLGLGLTEFARGGFRPRALLARRTLAIAVPVVLFALLWFAYPPKIASTWRALVNQPWGGEQARGLQGLLYYPRAIVDLAGSWWMAALLAGGLAAAWSRRDRPGIVLLASLALLLLAIGEVHHTKLPRHILPVFPSLYVLAGVAVADVWAGLRRPRAGRVAAVAALAAVGVLHVATLARRDWTSSVTSAGEEVPPVAGILRDVGALARANAPALVVGTSEVWAAPPLLDWYLVASGLLPVTAAGSAMDPRQERELAARVDHAHLPGFLRHGGARVLGRYDAPSSLRTLHLGDRLPEERSRFASVFARTLGSTPPGAVVAVVGTADSVPYPEGFLAPVLVDAGYRKVSVRDFPDLGTRVVLYRRP